jgi:hypothetical protein
MTCLFKCLPLTCQIGGWLTPWFSYLRAHATSTPGQKVAPISVAETAFCSPSFFLRRDVHDALHTVQKTFLFVVGIMGGERAQPSLNSKLIHLLIRYS